MLSIRSLYFVVVLFITQSTWALELPTDLCDANRCQGRQLEIYKDFLERGVGIQDLEAERVYSGVCHWKGIYKPEDTHYGAFFLYRHEGKLAHAGRFSYFSSSNPYENHTPEQAKQQWVTGEHRVSVQLEDYAYLHIDGGPSPHNQIFYWFRGDYEDPGVFYVTTIWGHSSVGICKLRMNDL